MKFRVLPNHLVATAEAAHDFFRRKRGFTSLKVEEAIIDGAELRPTFSKETAEGEIICIEVRDNSNLDPMMPFVRFCVDGGHYVKLYVVVPYNDQEHEVMANIEKAKKFGIGIISINGKATSVINEAVLLPLTGVRTIEPTDYPKRYRQDIATAEQTFKSGDPSKGCAGIYELIEALTRNIAAEAITKNLLENSSKPLTCDVNTGPWATVAKYLSNHFSHKKSACPDLKSALFARVQGITTHRNESGHKVKGKDKVKKKNRELKTRFESGCDLLLDLINAAKPLKLK